MPDDEKPKWWIPWWPMGVFRENQSCSDDFYMSIAFLVLAYFISIGLFSIGLKYVACGIVTLYLAMAWINVSAVEDLAKGERRRALAQQMFVAVLLISPLLLLFRASW